MKKINRNPVEIKGKLYQLCFPFDVGSPGCKDCDLMNGGCPLEEGEPICSCNKYQNENGGLPVWKEIKNGNA